MTNTAPQSTQRLVALQHPDFRLLWGGQLVSTIGSQMALAAVDWHVYTLLLDQSYTLTLFGYDIPFGAEALGLGTLGLVRIFPIILFGLLGGLVADARDRRHIMLATQSMSALLAAALAVLTISGHDSLLAIYGLTAALAATSAFDSPASQSLVPNLVPREHVTNAISLTTLNWQLGTVLGPAIAGLMLGAMDIGWIYAADAITFSTVIAALLFMRYRGHGHAEAQHAGMSGLMEGMRFVYGSRIIWSTMLLDFFATFFSSARTMLPIVAGSILNVGAAGYGALRAAEPLGAVIAGAIIATREDIRHQGVVLLISVAVYGLATALFGLSTAFALSFLLFTLTGAGDTVSTVIRTSIRQLQTPDHLRGRMVGVNMMFFKGGPQLGEIEAGLVASLFGAPFAIVTGGLATVLMTIWIAWRYPKLRNYRSDTAEIMI